MMMAAVLRFFRLLSISFPADLVLLPWVASLGTTFGGTATKVLLCALS